MKKMVKLLAVIAAIAMMASLAITGASASVSADGRTLTSADGKVYLTLEQEGENWFLYCGLNSGYADKVVYAFDTPNTTVSFTGITGVRNWVFNDEFEQVAGGTATVDTFVFAGAAEDGVGEGEFLGRGRVDGVGTLTVKGVFILTIGDGGEDEFIAIDGTINNNPEVTTSATTPATTPSDTTASDTTASDTTASDTTASSDTADVSVSTTSAGGGVKVPDGGITLAIIPTLIAAGAAIVASKRKSR